MLHAKEGTSEGLRAEKEAKAAALGRLASVKAGLAAKTQLVADLRRRVHA